MNFTKPACAHENRRVSRHPDQRLAWIVPGVVEVNRLLGKGSFGDVWECEVDGHVGTVAVKVFTTHHTAQQHRECQLLAKLQHPSLVKVLRVIEGCPNAIIMEVSPGGSLSQLIHDHREAFASVPIRARVRAMLDVVSCIQYLHANKILHRDVKPSNCLLSSDYRAGMDLFPQVRLADLGLARYAAPRMGKRVGTLIYMAPELMQTDNYSFQVDIYSCGIMFFELLTGTRPYSDARWQNHQAFALAIFMGERPSLDHLHCIAARGEICRVLEVCWDVDPANRPRAGVLANCLCCVALMT